MQEFLIYKSEDGELTPPTTVRLFRTVQPAGRRDVTREVEHYNLDMVLARGFFEQHCALFHCSSNATKQAAQATHK